MKGAIKFTLVVSLLTMLAAFAVDSIKTVNAKSEKIYVWTVFCQNIKTGEVFDANGYSHDTLILKNYIVYNSHGKVAIDTSTYITYNLLLRKTIIEE